MMCKLSQVMKYCQGQRPRPGVALSIAWPMLLEILHNLSSLLGHLQKLDHRSTFFSECKNANVTDQ